MYLLLSLELNAGVTTVGVAVVFGEAYFFLLSHTCWAAPLFFGDADVFGVAVVTAWRALFGSAITSIFPFSAFFNRDSLVSLDFGSLRSLLVPVG